MSQYSQIIGSFERTADFPLEANSVFESKQALDQFYADPINKATMYPGLTRVVVDDGLYWVKEVDNELTFVKFASEEGSSADLAAEATARENADVLLSNSINNLQTQINNITINWEEYD